MDPQDTGMTHEDVEMSSEDVETSSGEEDSDYEELEIFLVPLTPLSNFSDPSSDMSKSVRSI